MAASVEAESEPESEASTEMAASVEAESEPESVAAAVVAASVEEAAAVGEAASVEHPHRRHHLMPMMGEECTACSLVLVEVG